MFATQTILPSSAPATAAREEGMRLSAIHADMSLRVIGLPIDYWPETGLFGKQLNLQAIGSEGVTVL